MHTVSGSRPRSFTTLLIIGLLSVPLSTNAATRSGRVRRTQRRIKGIDIDGRLHRIGGAGKRKVAVVVFLSTECPISNGYIPRLNEIADLFGKARVKLFGVISDQSVTRDAARAHRKKFGIRFPVLFDASGALRERLKPTHAPHAFVLDRTGQIIYQGLIDDGFADLGKKRQRIRNHYLLTALQAGLRGKAPRTRSTKPIGCLLEDETQAADGGKVTFARDIAPIIFANCTRCHRRGEAGPFPLRTYVDVAKRSAQIVAVTKSRIMPPWKAAPDFGHFRGERRLTSREIQLIEAWSKAGKPRGNPADLPPVPRFARGWQLGKPDLILKMAKPFQLPAKGRDIYRHFVIPVGLRKDRLVAAMEFRPGNPRVTHHASVFFDNTGMARRLDAATPGYGYHGFGGPGFFPSGSLGNWLPGAVPQRLPEGTGRGFPKASDLVLQIHYQCTGKVETDQSTIGIYFAPDGARQLVDEFQVLNARLNVPPGARRHFHRATLTLPADVTIFDAAPHMHLLGREIKATAKLPDGVVKPLIWIKKWDFNWQGQYVYVKPIKLPKGTTITVDAWLDNSRHNPLNPNSPPQRAFWGEQTEDEMPLCQFRYSTRTRRDLQTVQRHYLKYLKQNFGPDLEVRVPR